MAQRRFASGTLLVLGLIAIFVVGWFAYRTTIPPTWLRDFGSDIALRATPDPNAPLPEDSRQATPRGLATSPFICLANVVHLPWDRFVAVTADGNLADHPLLSHLTWKDGDLAALAKELKTDERYQVVALVKDDTILDAELFYTFWAKLDAIARPEGYTRDQAVFTARVENGTYVLKPVDDPPPDACATTQAKR